MLRTVIWAAVCAAALAGQATAETIELRCRQTLSEIYSMGGPLLLSATYTDPLDVMIGLDTETDRATLDQNAGLFDVGGEQVLIMLASEQLKEVWEIDRATGRALVMAYVVSDARTIFVRREAQCDLPAGMAP